LIVDAVLLGSHRPQLVEFDGVVFDCAIAL
jgi:hypothetical protein